MHHRLADRISLRAQPTKPRASPAQHARATPETTRVRDRPADRCRRGARRALRRVERSLKREALPTDARQVAKPIHRAGRHAIGGFLGVAKLIVSDELARSPSVEKST